MEILMVIVGVGLWGYIGILFGRFWWRWEFLKNDMKMYGKDRSMEFGPYLVWALFGPLSYIMGAIIHYGDKDWGPR